MSFSIRNSGLRKLRQNGLKRSQIRHFSLDPTPIIQSTTESLQLLHAYSGITWWAFIPLTTIALRTTFTLPFAILQRKRTQKQHELRPIISAMYPVFKQNLAEKVNLAKLDVQRAENPIPTSLSTMSYEQIVMLTTKERRRRQKKLFKDNKCQLWKGFVLPVFQIPLWILLSMTFRNLSGWSNLDGSKKVLDDDLIREGILWFPDLTMTDPMGVLPVVIGVMSLCNIEWSFATMKLNRIGQGKSQSLRPTAYDALTNISKMGVVLLMGIATQAPAALSLYWLSSNMYSLVQNVALDMFFPVGYTPYTRLNFRKALAGSIPLTKI